MFIYCFISLHLYIAKFWHEWNYIVLVLLGVCGVLRQPCLSLSVDLDDATAQEEHE